MSSFRRFSTIIPFSILPISSFYSICDSSSSTPSPSPSADSSSGGKAQDCANPACHSTMEMLKLARKNINKKVVVKVDQQIQNPYQKGCPALREELGISTWKLIHTIAANYPDNPSDIDKENVLKFFQSLAYLYPCPHCAEDFQQSVAKTPPNVSSREALSMWCCELHNEVNKKLGLPVFPCVMSELDIRWKFGHDDCWKEHHHNE